MDPPGPVEIVLDASGSMRGRIGDTDKMTVAKRFLLGLRERLADGGPTPSLGLRVYGAGSHRLRRDCNDTRLLTRAGEPPEALDADLEAVSPLGVSPLARSLRMAADDPAGVFVLIADGGDNCAEDPCRVWRETVARSEGPRPRLHVVAIDPDPGDEDALRCLSRASSGTYLPIQSPDEVEAAVERLSLILQNRGLLDVRLTVGSERFSAPVRLTRSLTGEVVTAFVARAPRAVPAGIYTLVLETAPQIALERVLVLPGERTTIERSDFGRLEVTVEDPSGAEVRMPVSIRLPRRGPELRYVQTGQPVVLRAGTYHVQVDMGDTLAVREAVTVAPGQTTRLVMGGDEPGLLTILAPEFETPPPTRVLLYREGRTDTLMVGTPTPLAPGVYRMEVHTLPRFVGGEVRIESAGEATVTLPATAALGVRLLGTDGPIPGVRVSVREPMTGEVYGSFPTGERRLVMPGVFDLEVATAPPITVTRVTLVPGEERIVEYAGLSTITLDAPADERVRLEIWTSQGARRLAEATGLQPVVAARPGTYIARVTRAGEPLWQGPVMVASGKTARIHLPGP